LKSAKRDGKKIIWHDGKPFISGGDVVQSLINNLNETIAMLKKYMAVHVYIEKHKINYQLRHRAAVDEILFPNDNFCNEVHKKLIKNDRGKSPALSAPFLGVQCEVSEKAAAVLKEYVDKANAANRKRELGHIRERHGIVQDEIKVGDPGLAKLNNGGGVGRFVSRSTHPPDRATIERDILNVNLLTEEQIAQPRAPRTATEYISRRGYQGYAHMKVKK